MLCCGIQVGSQLARCAFQKYRKSSVKPPGGLFNFGPSRGGLIERGLVREGGAYSQNQLTRIYLEAFQFFYPLFCGINI